MEEFIGRKCWLNFVTEWIAARKGAREKGVLLVSNMEIGKSNNWDREY